MISATHQQKEVSGQLLARAEPQWARGRANAGTFGDTNANRSSGTHNRGQASAHNERATYQSEARSTGAALEGLRARHLGDTPAALIEQGTTLSQKVHCATIRELPEIVKRVEVNPPTLLIVGSVVQLHDKLNWFRPAGER